MLTFCVKFRIISTTMILSIVEVFVGVTQLYNKLLGVMITPLKISVVQGRGVGDARKCEERSGGLVPLV